MDEEPKGITGPVAAELTGIGTAPITTPAPADIIDTDYPFLRYATSVTEQYGLQVRELNEHAHGVHPLRTSGARQVSELMSLLDELSRRPLVQGASTLWGDYTQGRVTAVYNDDTDYTPGWRDDLLHLQLTTDPDWAAWMKVSGKWFSQVDFYDVVEELLHTVVEPDQADLLQVIDSVRGMEVPKTITLRLRPWEGHVETYDIEAWFRLNVDGGHLSLMIKLKPTQQLLRAAWSDMVGKIVEHTAMPVLAYRGKR